MRQRAAGVEETRERILAATMALHAEKGIAATTQADVAARAGLSPATVYRHFPTQGDLVRFCGGRSWELLSPPAPEDAPGLFADLPDTAARLRRLADETCSLYTRGDLGIQRAREDRDRIPEINELMRLAEASLEALARAALALEPPSEPRLRLVLALIDFGVWKSLREHGFPADAIPPLLAHLLHCALTAAPSDARAART